jgi:xanthine dehydrogenase accessory factor
VTGPVLPHVMVVGAGELGSAVCHRLRRAGLRVVAVDIENPRCIRRRVCFAVALTDGRAEVEGVVAEKVSEPSRVEELEARGAIPVLAGDFRSYAGTVRPDVIVDATLRKERSEMIRGLAPLTVGLGPGLEAGLGADVVIETNRGHDLGRVIYTGGAEPNTGVPGEILGKSRERVIRAPSAGVFSGGAGLGSLVRKGDRLGAIEGGEPVVAPVDGLLRGLVADGTRVSKGDKIGDVDPRGADIDVNTISDKGRAVAGGVLEAIMSWWVSHNA